PWLSGALSLIPSLAEALPLADRLPNRQAIIHGALKLIPALTEAVLELQEIPKQQLIAGLLKYCGYNDYAARLSCHLAPGTSPRDCDNHLEAGAASFTHASATEMTGRLLTEPQPAEVAHVA